MLTNEQLDGLLRNPTWIGEVREMPILLRIIAQAREANELRALREQTREITLLAARKLEEARQYRRDHDAMNVLRDATGTVVIQPIDLGTRWVSIGGDYLKSDKPDPAGALLEWAEKYEKGGA